LTGPAADGTVVKRPNAGKEPPQVQVFEGSHVI